MTNEDEEAQLLKRASLWAAAKWNYELTLKKLLEAGQDPNELEPNMGGTPLHFAAAFGHPEAASILIRAGAQVDKRDVRGSTPLRTAVVEDKIRAVSCLIEHGAD